MTEQCIRARVSGRVQGVFFRDSTRRLAVQLGITGHAINLPDGCVEVLACGESARIERLTGWLHTGPELARVTDVLVSSIDIEKPDGFVTG